MCCYNIYATNSPADFICSFDPVVTLDYFHTHEFNFPANNDHHCAYSTSINVCVKTRRYKFGFYFSIPITLILFYVNLIRVMGIFLY